MSPGNIPRRTRRRDRHRDRGPPRPPGGGSTDRLAIGRPTPLWGHRCDGRADRRPTEIYAWSRVPVIAARAAAAGEARVIGVRRQGHFPTVCKLEPELQFDFPRPSQRAAGAAATPNFTTRRADRGSDQRDSAMLPAMLDRAPCLLDIHFTARNLPSHALSRGKTYRVAPSGRARWCGRPALGHDRDGRGCRNQHGRRASGKPGPADRGTLRCSPTLRRGERYFFRANGLGWRRMRPGALCRTPEVTTCRGAVPRETAGVSRRAKNDHIPESIQPRRAQRIIDALEPEGRAGAAERVARSFRSGPSGRVAFAMSAPCDRSLRSDAAALLPALARLSPPGRFFAATQGQWGLWNWPSWLSAPPRWRRAHEPLREPARRNRRADPAFRLASILIGRCERPCDPRLRRPAAPRACDSASMQGLNTGIRVRSAAAASGRRIL